MKIHKNLELLFSYGFFIAVVFIYLYPDYRTVDYKAPQFFHLSLLNVFGLIFNLFIQKRKYRLPIVIGLYFLVSLISLISSFFALNQTESLVELSRLSTVFLLLINLYLISQNLRKVKIFISIVLSISLAIEVSLILVDAFDKFAAGEELFRRSLTTGIAGNINITAFSILLKLPFLIYILNKSKILLRVFIFYPFLFCCGLCIALLASRASYIALFIIIIIHLITSIIVFKRSKQSLSLIKSLLLTVLIFSSFYFSLELTKNTRQNAVERTISITKRDQSIDQRILFYRAAIDLFSKNPILGIGYGNYKLESIPYFIPKMKSYVVPYHAHNDFLEILAEIGLLGFIFYAGIFLISLYYLIRSIYLESSIDNFLLAIFISIIVYLIDANLNFPQSRPIIQVVIILNLALTLLLTKQNKQLTFNVNCFKPLIIFSFLVSPIIMYSNYRVLNSYIEQYITFNEFNSKKLNTSISEIEKHEEFYPNISLTTIPLGIIKANYYLSAQQPDKAIRKLNQTAKYNPYLQIENVLLSLAYSQKQIKDSAWFYGEKAFKNAPQNNFHFSNYIKLIREDSDINKLFELDSFLQKSNSEFKWAKFIDTIYKLRQDSLNDSDLLYLEQAELKFPNFDYVKQLKKTKEFSFQKLVEIRELEIKAKEAFVKNDFIIALERYDSLNKFIPTEAAYVENIARCHMRLKNYNKAIGFFKMLISDFNIDSGLPEFYIGALHYKLNQKTEACQFLLQSDNRGYSKAKDLLLSVCN